MFFGPKQCKPGKTIKIGVSAEIGQNQKWHLFFEKGVFLTWLKKWVWKAVFLKSCVFVKTPFFIVLSAKHCFSKTKTVCWKNRKYMKHSGLFLNMENVFWGFVFSGFNVIVVCFCVSAIVARVLKMIIFPSCLGFCGVAYSCLFGFGRFRCFGGSCVWLFFCSGFVFVCFGFVSVLLLVLFLFFIVFVFCLRV